MYPVWAWWGWGPGATKQSDLSWLDWSAPTDLSADGKALLFIESGEGGGENYSAYIRTTDGAPAVRLGDGAAFALSPDQKWVITGNIRSPLESTLLPTGAGESRKLPHAGVTLIRGRWLPDSKRYIFLGHEQDRGLRLWVQSVDGGNPTATSPEGIQATQWAISPDGKWWPRSSPTVKDICSRWMGANREPSLAFRMDLFPSGG